MLGVLAYSIPPVSTGTYVAGVQKGDWAFYGDIHSPDTSPLSLVPPEPFRSLAQAQSIRVEVQDVAGASIKAKQSWELLNQTDPKNVTLTTNVETGAGNLTGWIVAGHLNVSNTIPGNFYLIQSPTINSTTSITYWGTTRAVNVLDTTQQYPGYPGVMYHALVHWDSETGVLLEVTLTVYSISYPSLSFTGWVRITDTSLWPNPNRPDFAIDARTSSFILEAGSLTRILVTVDSLYGFAGAVRLNARVSPPGPTATLQPENISVGPGGPFTATLTINVTSSVVPGNYTVLVTGTNNKTTHSTAVRLTVKNPHVAEEAPDTILGVPPAEFYTITGVLAGGTAAGAVLTLRRRRYSGPRNMRLQAVLAISSEE